MASVEATEFCTTPGCGKPSSLQCPRCKELGIFTSFFCSQECFKGYFPEHKNLHSQRKKALAATRKAISNLRPGFLYTGPLRPYPQTPKRSLPDSVVRTCYADDPQGIPEDEERLGRSTDIEVLSEEDQENMRIVCKLAREVLDEGVAAVAVGVTADEIDRIVHEACVERDCYPSPLNYYNFPKSCCTSVNEVICHGIPDMRPLEDADILNIDVTVYHRGFHGDLNETVFVGNVVDEDQVLVKVAYECLQKAIAEVRPGNKYRDIGKIIQWHAQHHGLSVVKSYCGHGIHRLFHTAPNVPHYYKNKAVGVMRPGHCFTIEPMISAGTWRDVTWPDGWTAVTEDGRRSAQFEETLLVTDNGVEVLTRRRTSNLPYFAESSCYSQGTIA